jgi:hypothetical protein
MSRSAISLLAIAVSACAADPGTTEATASGGGKLVSLGGDGELVELERTATFSVIEVRKTPPGSVPSSMYILRGACAVLRARGAEYFKSEPIASVFPTYRLSFQMSATPSELTGPTKSLFSKSNCAALRF